MCHCGNGRVHAGEHRLAAVGSLSPPACLPALSVSAHSIQVKEQIRRQEGERGGMVYPLRVQQEPEVGRWGQTQVPVC